VASATDEGRERGQIEEWRGCRPWLSQPVEYDRVGINEVLINVAGDEVIEVEMAQREFFGIDRSQEPVVCRIKLSDVSLPE